MECDLLIFSVAVLLAFKGAQATVTWTSDATLSTRACKGDSVEFPWKYNASAPQTYIHLEFNFFPADSQPGETSVLIAVLSAEKFIPDNHQRRTPPHMEFLNNAGLRIKNVTAENSGNYYVKLGTKIDHGSLESYNSSLAHLEVLEPPSLKNGDQLVVTYAVNLSSDADRNESHVILTCGKFQTRGVPEASVIWKTQDGREMESTDYSDGFFHLSQNSSAVGSNYTCALNQSSVAKECTNVTSVTSIKPGWAVVDKGRTDLSFVQNEVHTLETEYTRMQAKLDNIMRRLEQLERCDRDPPTSCVEALAGCCSSGVVTLHPPNEAPYQAYCDQDVDRNGGGWMVIQRRQDGSVDFRQNWTQYEAGFGPIEGEFWLGLARLHHLTSQRDMSLRFDMMDMSNNTAYAVYQKFRVAGPADNYTLHLDGYTGTAGNSAGSDDYEFTTYDRDNDKRGDENCADMYGGGGFWYSACGYLSPNGQYNADGGSDWDGIFWQAWKNDYSRLRRIEMKIRPADCQ